MHIGDKRPEVRISHSPITGSASSSRPRASFAVEPKSRVPHAAIAVGAISAAVFTAAFVRSGYEDGGGQGLMASPGSETAGAIIRPTIDHHSLAYQDVPLSFPVDPLPANGASPVLPPRRSQSAGGGSLLQASGAQSVASRGGGGEPPPSSHAPSWADTHPAAASVALEYAPLGSAATRIEVTAAAAYDTSMGREEQAAGRSDRQSASRPSDPVTEYPAATESNPGISGAAARPSLVSNHEGEWPDGTAPAPDVAVFSPQTLAEVQSQAVVPADRPDMLGVGDFESDRLVEAPILKEAGSPDEAPPLYTAQLDAPAPRTRPPAETSARALLYAGEPAAAASGTGHRASGDEAKSTPQFAHSVHSDEQGSSSEPVESQHEPALLAVAPQAVDGPVLAIKPGVAAESDAGLDDEGAGSPAYSLPAGTEHVTLVTGPGSVPVGSLPLRISSDALVSVRLADLISLFEDRLDRPLFVWLKSSTSAREYVTFESLRSAGIDVQFDPEGRQVALGISDARTP